MQDITNFKPLYIGSFSNTQFLRFIPTTSLNSDTNYAEYDIIFIDTSALWESFNYDSNTIMNNSSLMNDFIYFLEQRFVRFIDFLNSGGTLVYLIDREPSNYEGSIYKHLPFLEDISFQKNLGKLIEFVGIPPLMLQFDKIITTMSYSHTLEGSGLKTFLKVPSSLQKVGSYYNLKSGATVAIAPLNYIGNSFDDEKLEHYLSCLANLLDSNSNKPISSLLVPSWNEDYVLPSEKIILDNLEKSKSDLALIENNIAREKEKLEAAISHKSLLYATGQDLENQVKETLIALGMNVESGPDDNKADLVARYKDMIIPIEVKGINKSASEKNVNQLDKWVGEVRESYVEPDEELEEHHIKYRAVLTNLGFDIEKLKKEKPDPKGLLIINTFINSPPVDRKDKSYPPNIVSRLKSKKLIGMDTIQLLNLFLLEGSEREDSLMKLLGSTGIYSGKEDIKHLLKKETN